VTNSRFRRTGFSEREGFYVFVALMEGDSPYEHELARVLIAIVSEVIGG
jgi:hypothetical protein